LCHYSDGRKDAFITALKVIESLPAPGLTEKITSCEIDELAEILESSNPVFRERILEALQSSVPLTGGEKGNKDA
jgi:hypothetical protein